MPRPPLRYRIANWFAHLSERISEAWYRLIGPVERLFGRLGEGAFGALDSFEGVESFVVGVVRTLFWPFIAVGRWLGRFLPVSEGGTGPINRALGYPLRLLQRLADKLNLDWLIVWAVWLLTPIWWPIAQLLGFANAWLATRRGRELALATPALVMAAPFAYVAVQGAVLNRGDVSERYKVAVREAAESGDYALVDLYERKLAQMGADTRRARYRTAIKRADAGDDAEAYARMVRLASPDRPGYPSAHAWLAQKLLTGQVNADMEPAIAEDPKANLSLAEKHLDRLEELDIEGAELSRLRAYVYMGTNRADEAIEALSPYTSKSLAASSMQMRVLAQARRRPEAKQQAQAFLELFKSQRRRTEPTVDDISAWALAAELTDSPREMESALKAWREADPDDDRPRLLLARYRREQAGRMLVDPTSSPEGTASLVNEAIELGGSPGWVNQVAAQLALQSKTDRHAAQVWRALATNEEASPVLLEAMATAAASQGQIVSARQLFERQIATATDRAVALNNYAWTLTQEPDPDLPKALKNVQLALDLRPNDYRFRETRGQVFLAMKRWEPAIKDLEYALNGLPESVEVHRSLAIAYEAISKPRLAEIHRRQALD